MLLKEPNSQELWCGNYVYENRMIECIMHRMSLVINFAFENIPLNFDDSLQLDI